MYIHEGFETARVNGDSPTETSSDGFWLEVWKQVNFQNPKSNFNNKEGIKMPIGVYIRTKPVWNKGLTKETSTIMAKLSEKGKVRNHDYMSGDKNPSKRQEVKEKISAFHKGGKFSDEHKEKIKNNHWSKRGFLN